MPLPFARGPVSDALLRLLHESPGLTDTADPADPADPVARAGLGAITAAAVRGSADPLSDEDLQLSLHLCYELHYRGLDGVDERWEWHPSLLAVRAQVERSVEDALRASVHPVDQRKDVDLELARLVDEDDGPALSAFLMRRASLEQFVEFVQHRSVYQLKEADPHAFVVPRLPPGPAKAALLEVQWDEFGGGRAERMHAALFAQTMRALGVDDRYGTWADLVPAATLATVNLMSLFALHRRWRGALLGHLAVLEMTSTTPNRRYAAGLRRLGFGRQATAFYDEHVLADAVHEQVAAVDLCGSFVRAEPQLRGDVLFGAAATLLLEARFGATLLDAWRCGRSSLRPRAARLTA